MVDAVTGMREISRASSLTGADGQVWGEVIGDLERIAAPFYRGRRRFRENRCLVMIDFYNRAFGRTPLPLAESVLDEPSSCGLAGWESLPYVETVLAAARSRQLPVVHTVSDEYMRGAGGGAVSAVHRDDSLAPEKDPSWSNSIKSELEPRDSELKVVKSRASAFYGTALDAYLRMNDLNALIICGESTSGCVRATVIDAYSRGYDVMVVEEAVFDRSPLSHRVNLFDMNLKYATVVTRDTAVDVINHDGEVMLEVVE